MKPDGKDRWLARGSASESRCDVPREGADAERSKRAAAQLRLVRLGSPMRSGLDRTGIEARPGCPDVPAFRSGEPFP